jgi:DeoR/GlpR family transcriptional regulator of sugar metabolism
MHERRDAILKFIEVSGEISIAALAERFSKWSEMTLRRDLAFLEKAGFLILTRGGARRIPYRYGMLEDIYSEREQRNHEEKQTIAAKAAALVEPGKGIYIDCGTTAMAFAREVPDCSMVVITSAPNIALDIIMRKEKPSVFMLGGTLSRKEIAVSDPEVPAQLEKLNIETAFMTASAYDEKFGFTVGTQAGAIFKRAVMKRAKKVVMMLDSSKSGGLLPFTFATPEDVDILVTDGAMDKNIAAGLENKIALVL